MDKLSRPGLQVEDVETAERLLSDYAPVLGPTDLRRYALRVVEAADPDGPEPVDDQLQQDRRYLELKQRRDGMWQLQGRLTSAVGAQLNAVLDPLARFRSSSIEDEHGNLVQIPDERPAAQRLHDALDEACGRLLKSADQPAVGGIPASVIVTVPLQDLLAKAGLAETSDGTLLSSEQLLRIADEAEIWPTIIDHHNIPLALGQNPTVGLPRPNHGADHPRRRMLLPRLHPPTQLVRSTPHPRLDSRRPHGPGQPDFGLSIPPHPFPAERLDLPDQHRRSTRMDTAPLDRPSPTTPTQHPHPTPPRPTPTQQKTTTSQGRVTLRLCGDALPSADAVPRSAVTVLNGR